MKKFSFEYYDAKRDRWESKWDSDGTDSKNAFPLAVRATLEVQGPARLSFEGVYQFKLEIPQGELKANF